MMKALGTDIGTIHFVGIGGIGMSGIAEVMHQLGYKVQGSDVADGYVVEKLRKAGIPVTIGHSADNLGDAAVVVCSTAIKDDNPEIAAAAERRLPRVRRAEMLAELMRMQKTVAVAGTHGKTTTTSMIAALLDAGGIDPTVINGGIINRYGSNARLGKSDWWVIEADESDGSFLRLDGTIAVVTNIDPEHLEHYGSFDAGQGRVRRVRRERALLRARGAVRRSSRGAEHHRPHPRPAHRHLRLLGAGRRPRRQCRRRCRAAPASTRSILGTRRRAADDRGRPVPIPGRHNVQNALAAIAVALELGISDEAIVARLRTVRRRQAPLHQGRRGRRRDRHRRLCPSSDRDPRGARPRRAKAPRGGSSRSCSRTATRGCNR